MCSGGLVVEVAVLLKLGLSPSRVQDAGVGRTARGCLAARLFGSEVVWQRGCLAARLLLAGGRVQCRDADVRDHIPAAAVPRHELAPGTDRAAIITFGDLRIRQSHFRFAGLPL